MIPASILGQYALETFAFTLALLVLVALVPAMKMREPRRALIVLAALNVLRFGGVAGSLAAIPHSPSPTFLVGVAIGDGIAATLAVAALVLLVRRSGRGLSAFVAMNVAGLLGILVSEIWLGWLDFGRQLARDTRLHGPTIGAAFYSALHVCAFYLVAALGRERSVIGNPTLEFGRCDRALGNQRADLLERQR
ncbi:hypothetical protein AKJ09_02255 [Labilithrix luteola]|uniref:Uncharacterized protein n=1 Tax=Labilithrix luteola TaxID=1391654 RepID=A0A0K1PQB9_9BACT|nr:hypothetical protein [Labilithrix luteola]AKU95591.1 hypothetical protein AKJ09_02255 [Labilithrix luteola]